MLVFMKKYLFFIVLNFCFYSLFSQNNSVAVDDTVYVKMGETITFNPLSNDYDPDGDELIIADTRRQYGSGIDIISFNDSTITFRIPKYFLTGMEYYYIYYTFDENSFYPDGWGKIKVFSDASDVDTLNINQISAPIFPLSIQFFDCYYGTEESMYSYPKESKASTIFTTSIWIGGKDGNDQLYFAGEKHRYHGGDFWSGPLSNDGEATTDSITASQWFRSWKVTKEELFYHKIHYNDVGYEMPEAVLNWPAHGNLDLNQSEYIAPFVDVDLDGFYHPEKGDYPLIKGDVSIFFVYNDQMIHQSQGNPLGVEIHCLAWAYKGRDITDPLSNTIFYSYKFFNKNVIPYYDTYVGVYADVDIGNPSNDFSGCQIENGNFYGYNGTEIDPDMDIFEGDTIFGYGTNIPAQSICILGGPFMDADGIDNSLGECNESINGAGFGDGIIDNEMFGMNRAILYSPNAYYPLYDPNIAPEFYNLMQGILKDGSIIGGDYPERFMYYGDTDPCQWSTDGNDSGHDTIWTEETTGNAPGDRRGLASMGPFTFEAGSVHYLDLALVTAPGDQEISSKDLLQEYVAQIKQDYLLNPEEFGNQYLTIPEESKVVEQLLVYPNPADGDIIRFELSNNQRATYFIYNATGQIMEQGELAVQKNHSLNIGHLPSGWYILEVKTGGQVLRSKLIL